MRSRIALEFNGAAKIVEETASRKLGLSGTQEDAAKGQTDKKQNAHVSRLGRERFLIGP